MEAAGWSERSLDEELAACVFWNDDVDEDLASLLLKGAKGLGGSTSGAMVSQRVKRGGDGPAICSCRVEPVWYDMCLVLIVRGGQVGSVRDDLNIRTIKSGMPVSRNGSRFTRTSRPF